MFFESTRAGPWNIENFVGKPRVLYKQVNAVFLQWEKEARAAMEAKAADLTITEGITTDKKEVHSKPWKDRRPSVAST